LAAYVSLTISEVSTDEIQLLAFAIAKMDGVGGYGGWRWIFIIEGVVTVILGLVTKFWAVDWPETASFLTEEERALLIARLSADTGDAVMNRLDKRAAKRIFSDPKIYLGTAAYFGTSTSQPLYQHGLTTISQVS
jgi:hypothetical protein